MYQSLYGRQNINSRRNHLLPGYHSYQNTVDFHSPSHDKDIAIVKQKEKIKFLKEKISFSNHLNQVSNDKEDLYVKNKVLSQKIVMMENNMMVLANDNKRLKSIVNDKNNMISNYEEVINESKNKLTKLTQVNDILREQINTANQKIITFRQNQSQRQKDINNTNAISTQYTDSNIRVVHCSKDKQGNMKHFNNPPLYTENNYLEEKEHEDNKNHGLLNEMSKLKVHIKELERNFKDRIGEKDKAIEQLWKEKEILITEIEQVSKDREQLTERLYTQNETEYNDILTLRTILNNMSAKKDFHDDIYLSNLQRLNVMIRDKNKQIDEMKQKIISNKDTPIQNKQVQFSTPIKESNIPLSPHQMTYTITNQPEAL